MLERYIGVKGAEANAGKRNLSHSIGNTIGSNNLKAPRRPNKGRKYNSNTPKDRNNRTKGLALLGRCPSRKPKVQIWLAKTNTKIYNTIMPLIYQPKSNTSSSWYREL